MFPFDDIIMHRANDDYISVFVQDYDNFDLYLQVYLDIDFFI